MNRIFLGSYELNDSAKLKFECDFYVQKFSHFPDLIIEFRDELIPSTKKLAKDSDIIAGVHSFLRSIGYEGAIPEKLIPEASSLVAESDPEFTAFATAKGWLDLSINSNEAKKVSLLSVLDSEQSHTLVIPIDEDSYGADGKEFIVLDFEKVTERVKRGTLNNLKAISSEILAKYSTLQLAESYEDRKALIDAKKEELGLHEFNDWQRQHLAADDSFFVQLIQSVSKEDVYKIALNAKVVGFTEHHFVFEVEG